MADMIVETYDTGGKVDTVVLTVPDHTPEQVNGDTLRQRAANALTANANYLAVATPTNAQVAAQVQVLTKECSALIRLLLGLLDSTSGA